MRLIDLDALIAKNCENIETEHHMRVAQLLTNIVNAPTISPDSLRPKGRWILTAHEERCNCRWNVTAECSECHHDKGEIYAGFVCGLRKDLAEEVILESAESVKLDNFCPNCGADMREDG